MTIYDSVWQIGSCNGGRDGYLGKNVWEGKRAISSGRLICSFCICTSCSMCTGSREWRDLYRLLYRELQRGIEFMRRKSGDSQHVCKQWADEDQEVDCIPGFVTFWWRKRHALRCLQRIPLSIKRRKWRYGNHVGLWEKRNSYSKGTDP